MDLTIKFIGGAETVTGSKTLVRYHDRNILVDCGLFQGLKKLRLKNWGKFPVAPASIDSVLITHAHLDHCGYVPLLVKNGFHNAIHCTAPTKDLAEIILKDSAKIQEEEAERANRLGYSKHRKARPLYDLKDVDRSLPLFVPHKYHDWIKLNGYARFRFLNAGHILGSGMVDLEIGGRRLLFTGDLGRKHPLLLDPPEHPGYVDALILESTYGNRNHPRTDPKEELHRIIWETIGRGGILIIPTFAVERAQELIYFLSILRKEGRLPQVPVYLDSPMGVNTTRVMMKAKRWHHLSPAQLRDMENTVQLIKDVNSSKAIVADPSPKIVMAGSGMITGGRVLHYLEKYISDKRNTVLLVGYQAVGTRGRALEEGASEIKFFGKYHQVKARVEKIESLSAHADQLEIISWLRHFPEKPGYIFLNHGEPEAADALRVKIKDELGWNCRVAKPMVRYRV